MPDSVLRLPKVKALTGKSRSGIYSGMLDGSFPSSVHIGPRSVGWLQSEIELWIEERVRQERGTRSEKR
jgi:prophage regulatory protein